MENKTLVLDEATWRCGRDSTNPNNRRGKFFTQLFNNKGYYCCLGQFSKQLNPEINDNHLLLGTPAAIYYAHSIIIQDLSEPTNVNNTNDVDNTNLAREAMAINDDEETTVEDKVRLLKELFAKRGYTIEFRPIQK